jgi:hypothetical protein
MKHAMKNIFLVWIALFVLTNGDEISSSMTGNLQNHDDSDCRNRYQFCSNYAAEGHCELNAGWMILNCPVSCRACHLRDPAVRCTREQLNMSSQAAYQPGDMNLMFSSLVEDYGDLYDVEVLSRDPWIVSFNNFLSASETLSMISLQTQWQKSTETGVSNSIGETSHIVRASRTSSTSWCFGECQTNSDVINVLDRISGVTKVGKICFEILQVLKCKGGVCICD